MENQWLKQKRENPDFHPDGIAAPKKVRDVKEAIDFVQELKSDPDFKNAKKAIKHVTLTTMGRWDNMDIQNLCDSPKMSDHFFWNGGVLRP